MSLVATRYRPMPGLVATSKQVAILTFGSENFQSSQRKGAGADQEEGDGIPHRSENGNSLAKCTLAPTSLNDMSSRSSNMSRDPFLL